jgi:hypothetical protein
MTNPNVANKQQGCIWQLLSMGKKAAKLPNYCILHWRLNALKLGEVLAIVYVKHEKHLLSLINKVGAVCTDRHGRRKGEIASPPLLV